MAIENKKQVQMSKEKKSSFHVPMNEKDKARFERAVKKCPNRAVKNKTDLFWYLLDSFCEALGVK